MSKEQKTRMLSIRVTETQYRCLEELSRRITRKTGFRITRSSIVLKLMEFGLPLLEKAFPESMPTEHGGRRTGTDDYY